MSRIVDLPRVKAALSELDRLVIKHPELCQGGQPWTAESVERAMGTPAKDRMAAMVERRAAQGIKRVLFFCDPKTREVIDRLRALYPDKTVDQIINNAIMDAAPSTPVASTVRRYGDAAMWSLVSQYLGEQLAGAEIARRLTAEGYTSRNGATLRGYRVLTDYQKWKEANP